MKQKSERKKPTEQQNALYFVGQELIVIYLQIITSAPDP